MQARIVVKPGVADCSSWRAAGLPLPSQIADPDLKHKYFALMGKASKIARASPKQARVLRTQASAILASAELRPSAAEDAGAAEVGGRSQATPTPTVPQTVDMFTAPASAAESEPRAVGLIEGLRRLKAQRTATQTA
jgi:hypothetical protein